MVDEPPTNMTKIQKGHTTEQTETAYPETYMDTAKDLIEQMAATEGHSDPYYGDVRDVIRIQKGNEIYFKQLDKDYNLEEFKKSGISWHNDDKNRIQVKKLVFIRLDYFK